jgi:hypothetical protein
MRIARPYWTPDIAKVLADADQAARAKVYAELGARVTYDPVNRRLVAEAAPAFACTTECVGGGSSTLSPRPAIWRFDWAA